MNSIFFQTNCQFLSKWEIISKCKNSLLNTCPPGEGGGFGPSYIGNVGSNVIYGYVVLAL
jgi:hypothetical protein